MAACRGCIIAFAHAYGSFIDCQGFRDVDVAIWTTASPGRWTDIDLSVRLSRVIGYPVDVRIVNGAPVSFLFHVLRWRVAVVRATPARRRTHFQASRDAHYIACHRPIEAALALRYHVSVRSSAGRPG